MSLKLFLKVIPSSIAASTHTEAREDPIGSETASTCRPPASKTLNNGARLLRQLEHPASLAYLDEVLGGFVARRGR